MPAIDHAPPPLPIIAARWLLVAVAATHVATPLLMTQWRGELATEIAVAHPELGAAAVASAQAVALWSAAVFHALLLALCVFLAVRLSNGRPWVRRLTIVSQLLSIVFGLVSWRSSAMFHWLIPAVDLGQLAIVALLTAPRSARDFFRRETGRPGVTIHGPTDA